MSSARSRNRVYAAGLFLVVGAFAAVPFAISQRRGAQGVAPLLGAAGQALCLGDHHVHVHPLRRTHRPTGERKIWQGERSEREKGR
jgi:hypothetical protein